ncbi:hypothetical protein YPPY94_4388, partial [Yersinia pestis PY-94]|jgi:hypothetical protein
MITP